MSKDNPDRLYSSGEWFERPENPRNDHDWVESTPPEEVIELQAQVARLERRNNILEEINRRHATELKERPSGLCMTPGCKRVVHSEGECWTCPDCARKVRDQLSWLKEYLEGLSLKYGMWFDKHEEPPPNDPEARAVYDATGRTFMTASEGLSEALGHLEGMDGQDSDTGS